MSVIRILPSEVASRIAAGEVVERPASVVKELVENAIDAGATRIRVATEQGGQRLIQVVDNGCGMDRSDAMMCLEAHATSKISKEADVGEIKSLGFRGEAIPSIASVSRFTLQTRRKEDTVGTEIVVDNGVIRDVADCGCAPGTNIKVSYLFANLPARKKFLKGPDTEDGHIEEMVLQLALSRPDIAFTLSVNGRDVLHASATNDIASRVLMLLGRDAFDSMLPVEYSEDGIYVRGFISKPGFTRSNRRDQRTIVNGRTANAETIYFAIREAYDTLIIKGRYPSAVLYIDLAADRVDVNVHPTKREVRFRDARQVSLIIGTALRTALRTMPGGEDKATLPQLTPSQPVIAARQEELKFDEPEPAPAPTPMSVETIQAPIVEAKDIQPALPSMIPPAPSVSPPPPPPPPAAPAPVETVRPAPPKDLVSMRICGRFGKRYALAESAHGLVIIDIRAAHQRILFEKLLVNLKQKSVQQQQLLIPVTINLGHEEAKFLRSQLRHFEELGFTVESFGGNSYLVTAVPAAYPNQDIAKAMRDIIDDLRQSRTTQVQSAVHLAQAACRHAISLKDSVTEAEIAHIVNQLAHTQMPYADPNGNPTMIHLTYAELEKRFKN
ncbi:MAG: DNA mismatch repair endonuclease MutL [Lentisphaerae bacterium]|jgi:DNA mismatch repair protein MutL|nr:DNA mismatch repair endonuclease MutL [Lentisphaerota bacterium]